MDSVRYSWVWGRFWLGLGAFWLVSTFGSMGMPKAAGEGLITLAMLVFVIVCMTTHRGNWSRWKKIGFVLAAWIVQLILMIPIGIALAIFVPQIGLVHLDKSIIFLASLPVVIFAMRYSREFVRLAEGPPPELIPEPPGEGLSPVEPSEQPKTAYLVRPEAGNNVSAPGPSELSGKSPSTPKPEPDPMKTPLVVGLCTCVILLVALFIYANFSEQNHQSDSTIQTQPNTSQKAGPYMPDVTSELELAVKMQRAGRLVDAIEIYSEVIRKNPRSAEAHNWRGIAYDELGETNKAFQDFSAAIEISPNYADAYNNRGEIYRKKKMHREALNDYLKAVQLESNFAEAYYNLAILSEAENRPGPAALNYENYLKCKPDVPDKAAIQVKILTLRQAAAAQQRPR